MADDLNSETNFLSPHFNPSTALSAQNVDLPYPKAKQFQSLAEYEDFMIKKRKENSTEQKSENSSANNKVKLKVCAVEASAATKQLPASSSTSAAIEFTEQKPTNTVVHVDKSAGEKEKTTRHKSNVFSRISDLHEKGPLSLLKKCISQNRLVKIIIRGPHSVRGYCHGYIVAFDNHFNIALKDVDEVYTNPLWISRSSRRRHTIANRLKEHHPPREFAQAQLDEQKQSTSSQQSTRRASLLKVDDPSQLKVSDSSRGTADDLSQSEGIVSSSSDRDNFSKLKDPSLQPLRQNSKQLKEDTSSQPVGHESVRLKGDHHSRLINDSTQLKGDESRQIDDRDTCQTTEEITELTSDLKWTRLNDSSDDEKLTYTPQNKTLRRHFNQLFIKGDNIVAVIAGHDLGNIT